MSDKIDSVNYSEFTYIMAPRPMPKPVGQWAIGSHDGCGTFFTVYKRPTDEQIQNTTDLLGWIWSDVK